MKRFFVGLPREVAVLAAVAVAVAVGFGVVAPAIPEFARSFGVGKFWAGAVISAFALMRFVSALGGGRLVDTFGERIILATGIGIVAVSTGLAGLSQSYPQLLILRGLGGVGSAMFTVSAIALLFRVVDDANRGRASGLFQAGFLLGGLLGPLAGGFLTDYSLRLPFYVYAVSLIAAGSIGFVFLQSARPRQDALPAGGEAPAVEDASATIAPRDDALGVDVGLGPTTVAAESPADSPAAPDAEPSAVAVSTSLREAWAHPAYRSAILVNFANGWAFFGVRVSMIPLFVTEEMGERAIWIGFGFLSASVAQTGFLLSAGRFVDRKGRRPAMIAGSAIAAAAFLALAVNESRPVFLLAMAATGVGAAFVGTAPGAVVGDIMHGRGGRVVAVFQMASDGGAILGPLVAGWLADQASFGAAFVVAAVVLAAATLASIRMPETLSEAHRAR
ncbi:MAG: MFS transporter [Nocardioidaceae bacterium]